jgi:hypothetical protein
MRLLEVFADPLFEANERDEKKGERKRLSPNKNNEVRCYAEREQTHPSLSGN